METQKIDFDKVYDDLVVFIVEANKDLAIAQVEENYEQCALIQTAIDLRLHNDSVMLSAYNGKPIPEIFNMLKAESNHTFDLILSAEEE